MSETSSKQDRFYVLIDWMASAIGFLTVMIVYRTSDSTDHLGYSGWLLNLLTTSLFVSAAAQYYSMLRNQSLKSMYLAFLPIVIAEGLVLSLIVSPAECLLLVAILLLNVWFAIFRGRLMRDGWLMKGALWNFSEQLLRVASLLVLCYGFRISSDRALLYATVFAYATCSFSSLAVMLKSDRRSGFSKLQKEDLAEIVQYSVIHMGIYLLSSLDVLVCKWYPERKAELVLLKPWGQALFVATTPFINLYLNRLRRRESARDVFQVWVLLYVLYLVGVFLFATPVSRLLFGHEVSVWSALLLVIEHVFLSFVIAFFYRSLQKREGYGKIMLATVACAALMSMIPWIIPGKWAYAGFVLAYAFTFWMLLSTRRKGTTSNAELVKKTVHG